MQKNFKPITKETIINEIVEKYPETIVVLMGYGLHCVGCHFSGFDTLESGAKIHGMDNETIEMMLKDLNEIVKQNKKLNS
ncbi:MAG: DUF1858 domain-containing protein [Nanoarchaeota archaeon]|nr:DUF1858 domain-containing protein [Nanoarchaeota archaeon]